jgi:hypothetical protein
MMCSPTNDMQWYASTCYYLFIYEMPVHRKKVRFCYYFHILWCSLLCFSLTINLMNTPWDPGIVYGALSKEEGECSEVQVPSLYLPILKEKGMKPSYMAIKKALYGRQPGSIYFFWFYFCCS